MLRTVADVREEHPQSASFQKHGGVAHQVVREDPGACLKAGQNVLRAQQDAWHRDRIVPPVPLPHAKVGRAQVLRPRAKCQPVVRKRHVRPLLFRRGSMVVHPDMAAFVVYVDIRGCDMVLTKGFVNAQHPRPVYGPGTAESVGVSQPDMPACVMREVEVIPPQRLFHPLRDANQARPVGVVSDACMQPGMDDGVAGKPPGLPDAVRRGAGPGGHCTGADGGRGGGDGGGAGVLCSLRITGSTPAPNRWTSSDPR